MRVLGLVDLLFLLLENAKQPMHVAGICVFELPDNHDDNFINELISQIDTDALPNFPFNQVLHRGVMWQAIRQFNIHHHCHYHRLKTGTMSEALASISRLHESRLARSRPLWELHLFDNLMPESEHQPKRFVLYLKVHHAVLDGVAAMRLFQRSLSHLPDEWLSQPLWLRNIRRQKTSFAIEKKSIASNLKSQLKSILPVYRELKNDYYLSKIQKSSAEHATAQGGFISSLQAPPSMLNQRIGTSRHLSVVALDKLRFVKLAQHFNVSTNDMVLAVCSFALREYLLSQNALPKEPLIAFIPASLRKNDTAIGNQISFIPTTLATDDANLSTRLDKIHRSVTAGKARIARMTQGEFIGYTAAHYWWAGLNLATRLYPKKQAFNLIISNVPGDDTPLYLNGARLSAIYPASVLFDGQALNISFTNYQDRIDFGIIACQMALPNIGILPTLIKQAVSEYETLADLG
ncbi:wax ester/triacylglycerol synthase family O-acyltransferase [Moraxella sp. ZJ142]|uniref:wax ester/triacylglycerol synthase family O-acyltransferase n=1 Tax=Moraxella marmotae TaxID=3344520 RepID=UPI0035D518EE